MGSSRVLQFWQAVDGKTLRGSFDRLHDRPAAHVLSAFASDAALILAHQEVAAAPDEVPAVTGLIAELGLSGVLFTADALHCQKRALNKLPRLATPCWRASSVRLAYGQQSANRPRSESTVLTPRRSSNPMASTACRAISRGPLQHPVQIAIIDFAGLVRLVRFIRTIAVTCSPSVAWCTDHRSADRAPWRCHAQRGNAGLMSADLTSIDRFCPSAAVERQLELLRALDAGLMRFRISSIARKVGCFVP